MLIPWDCADGFFEAYWRRPEAYLDEQVRRGISVFTRVGPDAEQRAVRNLRDDLASGRWAERNRDLVALEAGRPRRSPAHRLGRPRLIASATRNEYAATHASVQGLRDRPRRWRRKAPGAADGRPGEAGGAFWRQLPADRLRALQPRQRRPAQDRGADAVQEREPRPPHRDHLAAVAAARQLRHAGARPDAPRAELVRRLGRRDLPEPQPDLRRAAELHLRLRRRPRLPDGSAPDARAAHRARLGAHDRGHPGPDRELPRVRRDRDRLRLAHDPGVPREAEGPGRDDRVSRRGARVDGQLRVLGRRADRRRHPRRRRRDLGARHRRQHHPRPRRAGAGLRVGLRQQQDPRGKRARPRATGATWGRSTRTTTRTWT